MVKLEEQGRSMVEILGVLAIIGVLSVTGITGYNTAVNKYKANELLNEASKRAAVVVMQVAAGKTGTISLDEFGVQPVASASFGSSATVANGKITMTVANVPEKVCHQMKSALGTNSTTTITEECGSGSLTNIFNEDFSRGVTPGDSEWGLWEVSTCENDNDCGECEQCVYEECLKVPTENCQCSNNEMLVDWDQDGLNMVCTPCNYRWEAVTTSEECSKCPNREIINNVCVLKTCPSGYIRDVQGRCFPCSSTEPLWGFSSSECAKCPNRAFDEADGDHYCYLTRCPSGYVLSDGGLDSECVAL